MLMYTFKRYIFLKTEILKKSRYKGTEFNLLSRSNFNVQHTVRASVTVFKQYTHDRDHSLVLKPIKVLRLFGNGRLHVQVRSKIAVLVQLQGGVVQLHIEQKRKSVNDETTFTHDGRKCRAGQ